MAEKFGRYDLMERISAGGMAEIFLGRSSGAEGFEKILAIKRILPSMTDDETFVTMFIDEAKISANLNHSNIGQVFEFGQCNNQYFIAMEYIQGRDLRFIHKWFRQQNQTLPVNMALHIILGVCNGLDYAHNKRDRSGKPLNIVHRDVSPQNILMSYEGAVKLIDFGIAKAMQRATKTQGRQIKGKYGYMSPEQTEGGKLDGRSDLFSLGTILYELLTNKPLFIGPTLLATIQNVQRAEVPDVTAINPEVDERLMAILRKVLARDPDDRYQGADEMHMALEEYALESRQIFTSKQLSRWLKETFATDLKQSEVSLKPVQPKEPVEQSQPEVVVGPSKSEQHTGKELPEDIQPAKVSQEELAEYRPAILTEEKAAELTPPPAAPPEPMIPEPVSEPAAPMIPEPVSAPASMIPEPVAEAPAPGEALADTRPEPPVSGSAPGSDVLSSVPGVDAPIPEPDALPPLEEVSDDELAGLFGDDDEFMSALDADDPTVLDTEPKHDLLAQLGIISPEEAEAAKADEAAAQTAPVPDMVPQADEVLVSRLPEPDPVVPDEQPTGPVPLEQPPDPMVMPPVQEPLSGQVEVPPAVQEPPSGQVEVPAVVQEPPSEPIVAKPLPPRKDTSGGGIGKIIIVVVILVLLAAGGAVAFFVLRGVAPERPPDKPVPAEPADDADEDEDKDKAKGEEKAEEKGEEKAEEKGEEKSEEKAEPKDEAKEEPKAEPKEEPKPEPKEEPKPEPKEEPKPEPGKEPAKASADKPKADKKRRRRRKPGFLVVASRPAGARIYVDNKYTGRKTPVPPSSPLSLSPGYHPVHLVIGGKSYKFKVTIRSGKLSKLLKTLK